MKNIHVLPTDKPSNLLFEKISNRYYTNSRRKENSKNVQNQNIYITSDEGIKEGDWVLFISTNEVIKVPLGGFKGKVCKKIILTTDQDLIKDGVQAIDDEFLEWFVNNPSCDKVEVIPLRKSSGYYDEKDNWHWDFLAYKIIIPKEEPKQETLEEAARNYRDLKLPDDLYDAFIAGAKWQQERSYSGEDVYNILVEHTIELFKEESQTLDEFFNKFKKK